MDNLDEMSPSLGLQLDSSLLVLEVEANSGSAQAGILKGDTITHVNDTVVSSIDDVNSIIESRKTGDVVTMGVAGLETQLQVELSSSSSAHTLQEVRDLRAEAPGLDVHSAPIVSKDDALTEFQAKKPTLGCKVKDVADADGKKAGVQIVEIAVGGPLENTALKIDDQITSMNGTAVTSKGDLAKMLPSLVPGEMMKVGLKGRGEVGFMLGARNLSLRALRKLRVLSGVGDTYNVDSSSSNSHDDGSGGNTDGSGGVEKPQTATSQGSDDYGDDDDFGTFDDDDLDLDLDLDADDNDDGKTNIDAATPSAAEPTTDDLIEDVSDDIIADAVDDDAGGNTDDGAGDAHADENSDPSQAGGSDDAEAAMLARLKSLPRSLGIEVLPPPDEESEGVDVAKVEAWGGAVQAFIVTGDVIIQIDGKDCNNIATFDAVVNGKVCGDIVQLTVLRGIDGFEDKLNVEVASSDTSVALHTIRSMRRELDLPVYDRNIISPEDAETLLRSFTSSMGFTPVLRETEGGAGIEITALEENGPADRAGLVNGDTAVLMNKTPITTVASFTALLSECLPGTQADLQLLSKDGGEHHETSSVEIGGKVRVCATVCVLL